MTNTRNPTDDFLNALADLVAEKVIAKLDARPQQELYTIAELAERYGVSKDTIDRRVRDGRFGEIVRIGSKRRITADGVRHYDAMNKARN
ncbi:MAG: helix-turn-helix domain-containing protein [Faecalibacterium sp.]|nr:helix-turn-helix domain-containing protein [Faecalibacterium sp.]